jgi:hypothetical protein
LCSLLLLGGVVAAVAIYVLRASPDAVDSAAFVEPAGTTIAAPEQRSAPPTLVPTIAPELSADGPDGQTQAIAMLPTVAAPKELPTAATEPTPTPRAVIVATVIPMTLPPPAATHPPTQLLSGQPNDAYLTPSDAPQALAAPAAQIVAAATEPAASAFQPARADSVAPTRVSTASSNLQRARALQTNRVHRGSTRNQPTSVDPPPAAPASESPAWQAAQDPVTQSGATNRVLAPSGSVPDANAIRADVAARVKAPRP